MPTLHVFELLREAFRGGDTHANRFYVGKILENVGSYDRESSYPYELVNKNSRLRNLEKQLMILKQLCSTRKSSDMYSGFDWNT